MNHNEKQQFPPKDDLTTNLEFITAILEQFSQVFKLKVVDEAKNVSSIARGLSDFYSWETWGESGGWPSLDEGFNELDIRLDELDRQVNHLDSSIGTIQQIYENFILKQLLVLLVSALEEYLRAVFEFGLRQKHNLNDRATTELVRRYNFQNWGNFVDAYKTFLEIKISFANPQDVIILLEKRHVIVHRRGTVDKKAQSVIGLPEGEMLQISDIDVKEGVDLVSKLATHIADVWFEDKGESE